MSNRPAPLPASKSSAEAQTGDDLLVATSNRVENLLVAAILLLAALLRFYRIGASSLWSDEGNSWALASRSFARIAHDAALDIHPPGYYWALKVWTMIFGSDVVAIRSLSAVAGIALIYAIYRIGRSYRRPFESISSLAIVAALVATLNPLQVYYSQEARMYMLLALESAGLFWALSALTARQQATGRQ